MRFVIAALLVSFLACFVKAENTHLPLQIATLIESASSWEEVPFDVYLAKLPRIATQAFANDPYHSLTWRAWLSQRRSLPDIVASRATETAVMPVSTGSTGPLR